MSSKDALLNGFNRREVERVSQPYALYLVSKEDIVREMEWCSCGSKAG
jgi:hypothetical protein